MKIVYKNKIYDIYGFKVEKYFHGYDYDTEKTEFTYDDVFLIYEDNMFWSWVSINDCKPVEESEK